MNKKRFATQIILAVTLPLKVAGNFSTDYCNAVASTMTPLLESDPANPCILFTEGMVADPWDAAGDQVTATCPDRLTYAWKALEGGVEATLNTFVVTTGWR